MLRRPSSATASLLQILDFASWVSQCSCCTPRLWPASCRPGDLGDELVAAEFEGGDAREVAVAGPAVHPTPADGCRRRRCVVSLTDRRARP